MKSKAAYLISLCFLLSVLVLSGMIAAQQQNTGAPRRFPQPSPEKEVTVTAIPGVIAAGAKWKLVWQGPDNADGLVGTKDGGLLFAQEQPSTIGMLDPADKFSIFVKDTRGTGGVAVDNKGRLLGAERTCSDPGGKPEECHEPAKLVVLHPTREVVASNYNGKTFWRMNGDVAPDSKGGAYFADAAATYYVNPAGKVSLVAPKDEVGSNGIILSPDEKTLYLTNGKTIVAYEVRPDGSTTNKRTFTTLDGGASGDGMCVDSEGRLYVSAGDTGIQVFSPQGKHLGNIPLPRSATSVAFSGPNKGVLYGKGGGMKLPNGTEYRTPDGVRNNAKAIYKIDMIAHGFPGRSR
jgi:gluconolactonase